MLSTVKGSELSRVFSDLSTILKGASSSAVGVCVQNQQFIFTTNAGIMYRGVVNILRADEHVAIDMTVLFESVGGFIPKREDVTIEATTTFLNVITSTGSFALGQGTSVITPYTQRSKQRLPIKFGNLRNTVQRLSKITPLFKGLQKDYPVEFFGDYAVIKTPTLIVRTRSTDLKGMFSIEQLKSIVAFHPEEFGTADMLEFFRDSCILAMPYKSVVATSTLDKLMSDLRSYGTWRWDGVPQAFVEVQRIVGKATVTIGVMSNGIALTLRRPGFVLQKIYGDSSNILRQFDIQLDIFTMCLSLLGDEVDIEISGGENKICLSNTETCILICV